jgi:hypothetical protein
MRRIPISGVAQGVWFVERSSLSAAVTPSETSKPLLRTKPFTPRQQGVKTAEFRASDDPEGPDAILHPGVRPISFVPRIYADVKACRPRATSDQTELSDRIKMLDSKVLEQL